MHNLRYPMLAPDGNGGGDPAPATAPTAPSTPATAPATGKVWTDDYVQQLRDEAKNHRLGKKTAETLLRKVLGLKDEEDIDETKITAYQTKQQQAIADAASKANARVIAAEIKLMADYDPKLLARLVDHSKISVDDAGNVTGLKEQLPALEAEFPAIKVAGKPAAAAPAAGAGGFNPPATSNGTEIQQTEEALKAAQLAGNTALVIALRNKLFTLQKG